MKKLTIFRCSVLIDVQVIIDKWWSTFRLNVDKAKGRICRGACGKVRKLGTMSTSQIFSFGVYDCLQKENRDEDRSP